MNQTPFEFVGSHGKTRKRVNTHRIFFNHLLAKKENFLHELLFRFQYQQIVKDIQAKRQKDNTLDKNIDIISRSTNEKNPSLYINYYSNNIKVFHISIHLCPHIFKKQSNGLIHAIQNNHTVKQIHPTMKKQNKKPRTGCIIQICGHPTSANTIVFSIGNMLNYTLNPIFQKEAAIVVDILNAYFDTQNPLYLGKTTKRSNSRTDTVYKRIQTSVDTEKQSHYKF